MTCSTDTRKRRRTADAATGGCLSREIVTTRLIRAPRTHVFQAFRNPERLARWWGPKGFSNTFEEFDMRPGGRWRFVMHGPNGANFPNESVFLDITEPERIVFRHESAPQFEMTISLLEERDGTLLTWRMLFPSEADCAKVRTLAVGANEQNLDRLEAEVNRVG
jgi:uncharacterized protein YndB with AHSA1/START domain